MLASNAAGESVSLMLLERGIGWMDPASTAPTAAWFTYTFTDAEWASIVALFPQAKASQPPALCPSSRGQSGWIEPSSAVRIVRCAGTGEYELNPKQVGLLQEALASASTPPPDSCQPDPEGWLVLVDAAGRRAIWRQTCTGFVSTTSPARFWAATPDVSAWLFSLPPR